MHEKIIIYENFIQMKYFDQLKEYFDNIVNSIKHDSSDLAKLFTFRCKI
jgi:hypothetical protein